MLRGGTEQRGQVLPFAFFHIEVGQEMLQYVRQPSASHDERVAGEMTDDKV